MWDTILQPGLASAVLDFTNDLSLLLVGLLSVIWLSAGVLIFMAVQHYLSQKTQPATKAASSPPDYRDAA